MNIIRQNIVSIIVFVYVLLGFLIYNFEEISIGLFLMFLIMISWFWRQIIKNRFVFVLDVSKNALDSNLIVAIFLFETIVFIRNTFMANLDNKIYNWCMLLFLMSFMYLYVKDTYRRMNIFEVTVYAGIVVMGVILFAYIGNINGNEMLVNLISDKASVASWALLISEVGMYAYCFCEEKVKSCFYLLATTLSFFVLCMNHNCLSIWIMLFCLLLFMVLVNPTAKIIRRILHLLFLFLLIQSNLVLLTDYTNIFLVKINLNLEASIYMNIILVGGGIALLLFWRRLSKDIDINKVSMLKFQKIIKYTFCFLIIVLLGIIFGGNSWYELADTLSGRMIKCAAIPIIRELAQNRSGLSVIIEYQGALGCILFFAMIYLSLKKLIQNYQVDKQVTIACILISITFLVQLFFFVPSINVIPIYFTYLLCGAFAKDEIECKFFNEQDYGGDKNEIR